MFELNNDWNDLLKDEFSKEYFLKIKSFLEKEYKENTIYPAKENIFNALNMSSYKDTKVVILGQDPYHEPGQAHGLAFSVLSGIKLPPSLINIYKELYNEYNLPISDSGNLTPWAKQGVLLLNNVLTVRKGEANSHKGLGWEIFTDKIIELLNNKKTPVVFVFWGSNAMEKKDLVTSSRHLVLEAPHPSPLSAYRGFFGCNHFKMINDFLVSKGYKAISWEIPSKNISLF